MPDELKSDANYSFWQSGKMTKGAVAAANADAVDAGISILEQGGNAVDAVIATAYAMGTVEPLDSGLGAGGFMIIHEASSGKTETIDFIGTAPVSARYQLYASKSSEGDYQIRVKGNANVYGHKAIAAPGSVRGFDKALKAYGSLDLATLLQPSIKLAEEGFKVSHKADIRMARAEDGLRTTAECARLLLKPDGSLFKKGDRMANPDYGKSLRILAEDGPETMYTGHLAEKIIAEMEANDGFLSREDLRNYKAIWREPAVGTYHGRTVATMPPPSSGALVLSGLRALAAEDNPGMDDNERLARAMLKMFEQRGAALGDPAFVDMDLSILGLGGGQSGETTSLAAMDAEGNAACITYSNNNHSGVVVPGTGILMNNQMQLFNPWPQNPNEVIGGKRPASSMMPTLVFGDHGVELAIGASGATRIPTALMQVMFKLFQNNAPLQDALGDTRVHAEVETMLADAELGQSAQDLADRLGLELTMMPGRDPMLASVQAIHRRPDEVTAAGDPRSRAVGRVI